MLSNLPPLILTQTPSCNYLAMRGSNVVLRLPDDAVLWLKEQGDKGEFSEQFKRLFKENWQFDKLPSIGGAIHFREKTISSYTDASYELNMACNYSCEHCYLDERKNKKLDLNDRKKLFEIMSQSGVIRLHMSGGEPLIDKGFKETYRMAQEAGFLIRLSSNGYALG